jgi:predicted DNA-binding transcriptional regulator AlpA
MSTSPSIHLADAENRDIFDSLESCEKLLTAREVARILSISEKTVYGYVSRNLIPHYKIEANVRIGAAARCFLRLGALRVVIGEGPGHQRDTELVVQAAGLKPHLAERQIEFVDLNRDELRKVKLKANYGGLGDLEANSAARTVPQRFRNRIRRRAAAHSRPMAVPSA